MVSSPPSHARKLPSLPVKQKLPLFAMYVLHSLAEQNPNAESPRYRPADDVDGVPTNLPVSSVNISTATEEDKLADVLLMSTV